MNISKVVKTFSSFKEKEESKNERIRWTVHRFIFPKDDNETEAKASGAYSEDLVSDFMLYCPKCMKLIPVELHNEREDLLRLHFCPKCQSALHSEKEDNVRGIERYEEVIEDFQNITSSLVAIELLEKMSLTDFEKDVKSKIQKELQEKIIENRVLARLESRSASSFVVTQKELKKCEMQIFIEDNNEVRHASEADLNSKPSVSNVSNGEMLSPFKERVRRILQSYFSERKAKEERIQRNIENKGF